MRRRMVGRSTRPLSPPTRNSSAKPWIEVSGVRNSCEASAKNWRKRLSVASRSAKADSMSPSMVLRASPSWPTSLGPPEGLTRWERSPAEITRAVPAIRSNGRSPRRSTSQEPTDRITSSAARPAVSISTKRCRASVTSVVGMAMIVVV